MMRTTQQEIDILNKAAFDDFVYREIIAVRRIRQPWLFEMLSEEKIFEETSRLARSVEASGWVYSTPITFYTELYMELGIGMESDPQYKWIKELRTQYADKDEMEAYQALYKEYLRRFAEAEGEKRVRHEIAISVLPHLSLTDLPSEDHDLCAKIKNFLDQLYPTRWKLFVAEEIDAWIEEGFRVARDEYHFQQPLHQSLVVLMRLFFGHQCWRDPFTPWAHPQNLSSVRGVDNSNAIAEKYWNTMRELLTKSFAAAAVAAAMAAA